MKIKNFRWWIVTLIAMATAINYLDRQNLPVVISEIRKTIPIDDVQFGIINSLFLFAYGTMYAVGGRILDVFGSRVGYAAMIIWWSLANILHGLVSTITGLGIARFLLGIGEGGGFPGSAKVVSEWFPAKERSFAFGIFNTGSSLGAVIAPPLIAFIATSFGWRWSFFITGLFGLIWVICWIRIYTLPAKSKYVTAEEKNFIESSLKTDHSLRDSGMVPWISLFRYRQVWGLMVIKFLTDAGWFFFIFWLPKYLTDIRGLNIMDIGTYAWIPYAFAGAGSFIGGWLSSFLFKRSLSLDWSRKIPLGIAAALLPTSLLITDASLNMAVLFFSMAMFGHQCWSTIVQTLAADIFPSKVVGSVAGLMGCVGMYGAMLFSLVIGFVIERFGYDTAFLISGLLHPLSFILLFIIIRKIEFLKVVPN
jgi:ACS family hexuronate transporter-like MFS transporter